MTNSEEAPFPPNYNPAQIRSKLERQFLEFHRLNPRIYHMFVQFAYQWLSSGRGFCGMRLLFERVRWQVLISTVGDPFKLNNNYCTFYSRLIWGLEPDLAKLFRFRRMKVPCTFGPSFEELPPGEHVI